MTQLAIVVLALDHAGRGKDSVIGTDIIVCSFVTFQGYIAAYAHTLKMSKPVTCLTLMANCLILLAPLPEFGAETMTSLSTEYALRILPSVRRSWNTFNGLALLVSTVRARCCCF